MIIKTAVNWFNVILFINMDYSVWKDAIEECFLDNIQEEALRKAEWKFNFSENICPDEMTGKY